MGLAWQQGPLATRSVGQFLVADPLPERRSEEHTSELQSLRHLVCRLLLEKKKDEQALEIHLGHRTVKAGRRAVHIQQEVDRQRATAFRVSRLVPRLAACPPCDGGRPRASR